MSESGRMRRTRTLENAQNGVTDSQPFKSVKVRQSHDLSDLTMIENNLGR